MPRPLECPDLEDLVKRYLAGSSEKQLAHEHRVSRTVVRRWLLEAGVEPRGRSAAERVKWEQIKARGRSAVRRQCGSAWRAARGRTVSDATKRASARTRQARNIKTGVRAKHCDELWIRGLLEEVGWTLTPQLAVGPYNVDLANRARGVAVEVVSNGVTRDYAPTFRKRTEHLLDAGWHVVFVDLIGRRARDVAHIRKELVASLELVRAHEPALHGRYRVIRSDGKPASSLRKHLKGLPEILRPDPADKSP